MCHDTVNISSLSFSPCSHCLLNFLSSLIKLMLHVSIVSIGSQPLLLQNVLSCLLLQAEHLVASFFPKKLLELDYFLKVSDPY